MSDFKHGVEIEKKYIIVMPEMAALAAMDSHNCDEIVQTYLTSPEGVTRRVRKRSGKLGTRYYETVKKRIDAISALESERELSREEYEQLRKEIDPRTTPIVKVRHSFIYLGQMFEIDVYPEWHHTAILETELRDREITVEFPAFISVVREVSGIKSYSNAAMSRHFPSEDEVGLK